MSVPQEKNTNLKDYFRGHKAGKLMMKAAVGVGITIPATILAFNAMKADVRADATKTPYQKVLAERSLTATEGNFVIAESLVALTLLCAGVQELNAGAQEIGGNLDSEATASQAQAPPPTSTIN